MTKDEAITILKEMRDGTTYGSHVCEAFDMGIKALEQLESRWIPCSERLPEPGEEVLVSTKFGLEVAAEMDGGDLWFTSTLVLGDDEVFAWMPLPEPYKKEKTDDERRGQ